MLVGPPPSMGAWVVDIGGGGGCYVRVEVRVEASRARSSASALVWKSVELGTRQEKKPTKRKRS